MNLQDQCCTRKQGQRLVELGVTVKSIFWHMPAKSVPHGEYIQYGWHGDTLSPAFNVAELGEMLPEDPDSEKRMHYSWYHRKCWRGHSVGYSQIGGNEHIEVAWYKTEAQTRAALLIHLLENNLITADEVNNRDNIILPL